MDGFGTSGRVQVYSGRRSFPRRLVCLASFLLWCGRPGLANVIPQSGLEVQRIGINHQGYLQETRNDNLNLAAHNQRLSALSQEPHKTIATGEKIVNDDKIFQVIVPISLAAFFILMALLLCVRSCQKRHQQQHAQTGNGVCRTGPFNRHSVLESTRSSTILEAVVFTSPLSLSTNSLHSPQSPTLSKWQTSPLGLVANSALSDV